MAKVKYEAVLTPEEFDLFSKFLKDLRALRNKKCIEQQPKEKGGK